MSTSATQQFDGTTIEEALGAAVASLGDDVEILDAQRVRKRRRFGVRREERFEVVAAPRSSADEFDDVLRRMVERVDDRERAHEVDLRGAQAEATVDLRTSGGGVDLADSDLTWWEGAEFVVPEPPTPVGKAPDVDLEIDVRTPPAPHATPVPADAQVMVPVHGAPPAVGADDRPVRRPAPAAVPSAPPARPTGGAITWSIDALADLGIAPLVLERVAAHEPRADLEWVAALAAAIEDVAAAIDPHGSNVELTGHGRQAAVDLIGGLCRGMRVGHLVIDGVRVEATPVELALGVRACLQG